MKLNKITKLKDFACFKCFNWPDELPEFSDQINVLFGWNGSGKTTISKILQNIENQESQYDNKFEIKVDGERYSKIDQLKDCAGKIRVFNSFYTRQKLKAHRSNPDSNIPPILYIGEDSDDYIKTKKQLIAAKIKLEETKREERHNKLATQTAKTISIKLGGFKGISKELRGNLYSDYTRADFKKRIEYLELKNIKNASRYILAKEEKSNLFSRLQKISQKEEIVKEIKEWLGWISNDERIKDIGQALSLTPTQRQISDRIDKSTESERDWIREGVSIHFNEDKDLSACLFCTSDIPNRDELTKHFSKEVVVNISKIDKYIDAVDSFVNSIGDKSESIKEFLNDAELIKLFKLIKDKLKEKRRNPEKKIDIPNLEKSVGDLQSQLGEILKKEFNEPAWSLEKHYVAEQYKKYKSYRSEKDKQQESVGRLMKNLDDIGKRIEDTDMPAKKINSCIRKTFPYKNIKLEADQEKKGYIIKRNNKECYLNDLSEGEKNFIALTYFIIELDDGDLPDDGIVVIDDPISSLDKNTIFNVFSAITDNMEDQTQKAKRQYFILTHNLDFFGHLKSHYRTKIDKSIKCQERKDKCVNCEGQGNCRKLIIYNIKHDSRGSTIECLDKDLINSTSDYYYGWFILNKIQRKLISGSKVSVEDSYVISNLLRRCLETFLLWQFSGNSFRNMLENAYIKARKTSKGNLAFREDYKSMLRFTNYGSHKFKDHLSIEQLLIDSQTNMSKIEEALNLIKVLNEDHHNLISSYERSKKHSVAKLNPTNDRSC